MRISVSLDVPSLAAGLDFYGKALGFAEVSRPMPTMANIASGEARILLIEKPEGSFPFPGAPEPRGYARHWTPVHLDFHVADAKAARESAEAAGATCEAWWDIPGRPRVAFMADPFGHGFCLIGHSS
jgi:catechol 2,3-dioxygenase-like lactoylglutathione lyase family enzyme